MKRTWTFAVGLTFGLLMAFSFVAWVELSLAKPPISLIDKALAAPAGTIQALDFFKAVFERVRSDYVDKVDDRKLVEAALAGMLTSLDPQSRYMDAMVFRDTQVPARSDFAGLGMEVTKVDGLLTVVAPIDESPAAKAGVMTNDIITHLDGEPVQDLTLNQAVEKMRGPVNTNIQLRIMRKSAEKPIELSVTRDIIRQRSVRTRSIDDVAYIRITVFGAQTTELLKEAITNLQEQIRPDRLKGYVLDLRNNPGGLLDQAVSVSDAYLDRGEIVSVRGRTPKETQRFNAQAGDLTKSKPIIVLINGGTSAASEIVAGALQENRRAVVVGTRSFGYGTVQTTIPLGSGNGAMRLTTGRYYTPAGRPIEANGVAPDIEVMQDLPEELKSKSDASFRGYPSGAGVTEQPGLQSYIPPNSNDDRVLQIAVDLLRGVRKNPAFPPKAAVPN